MTSASPSLFLFVSMTLAAPVQAEQLPPASVAPVARLQLADDLYDIPPPRRAPRFRLPDPSDLFPDIIGRGAAWLSGARFSTQADLVGGAGPGARVDISIGFNF